jgi:hypothetical protein
LLGQLKEGYGSSVYWLFSFYFFSSSHSGDRTRTSLIHTTAFLDDCETLGEGEALKTLSTELCIVGYFTMDMLLQ